MGVSGQRHASAALSLGKIRYPLYRRLGGPRNRSGQVRKISPPPGFDFRTVQPVANRYTDCAIPASRNNLIKNINWSANQMFICIRVGEDGLYVRVSRIHYEAWSLKRLPFPA
jgi:hypothetical protein